jgi:hypothetical protein
MPHLDNCHACKGQRVQLDASRHEYGYSAKSLYHCPFCWVPGDAAPVASPDDLRDAAMARMLASTGLTRDEYYAKFEAWA